MNMKKTLGILATAMTALACGWSQQARAEGDIRSIFAVPTDQHPVVTTTQGVVPGCVSYADGDYVTSGQELRFCIRLLKKDFAPGAPQTNNWDLVYTGFGSEVADWSINPFRVGIMVGGRLRYAELVKGGVDNDSNAGFTDLVFSYVAKSGDMAMPVKLATSSGEEAGSEENLDTVYLFDTSRFNLKALPADGSAPTEDVYATMSFMSQMSSVPDIAPVQRDYDLSLCNINIKTIDFDENPTQAGYADSGIWRKIRANSTEAEPYAAALRVEGGLTNDLSSTVYLWTTNNNAAILSNGTEQEHVLKDGTVTKVYAATIPPGASEFSFKIRGVTQGATADVFLSSTPTNIYNGAGDVVQNFLVRKVAVIEPPAPSVSITLGQSYADSLDVVCNTNRNPFVSVCRMTVGISEKFTEDVTVDLNPVLDGIADVYDAKIIAITENASGLWKGSSVDKVVFSASEDVLSKTLYVYALGSTEKSASYEYGINFSPKVVPEAAAAFYKDKKGCQLRVHGMRPVVYYPAEGQTLSFIGGVEQQVEVQIDDSYRNYAGGDIEGFEGYTITWDRGSGMNSKLVFNNQVPVGGKITLPIRYATAKEYKSSLTVRNPEGLETTVHFIAVVGKPAQVFLTTEDDKTQVTVPESDSAGLSVKVCLSEEYGDDVLYAFIVPANEDAFNYSQSNLFAYDKDGNSTGKRGFKLIDATAVIPAERIFFKDGPSAPEFQVVLCTTETYDPASVVTDYQSQTLYVTVNNVKPSVSYVNVGGARLHDGEMTPTIPQGIPKQFTAKIEDVKADISSTNTATCHVLMWTIVDGRGLPQTIYTFGSNTIWYAFQNEGTNNYVEVRAIDKDMRTPGDFTWIPDPDEEGGGHWKAPDDDPDWSEPIRFGVNVGVTPSVVIEPAWGTDRIDEDKVCKFNVYLSEPPSKKVNIVVDVVTNGVHVDSIELSASDFSISANQPSVNSVTLKGIDGTSWTEGLQITASVTNETIDTATETKMKDLYLPAAYTFSIENVAPRFTRPPDTTNVFSVAIGQEIKIDWTVNDIEIDLRDGMTVEFTGDCEPMSMTSKFGEVDVRNGSYTTSFSSGGDKVIFMTVTDKDGGVHSLTRYYYVKPSLNLYLTPKSPSWNSATELAKIYNSAVGLGAGQVWTENGALAKVFGDYMQQWNFSIDDAKKMVFFYGKGFAVGESMPAKYGAYTYSNKELDSFFYCWINNVSDPSSGAITGEMLMLNPSVGPMEMQGSVALPEGEDDSTQYEDRNVTGVFSLEKMPSDNVGDINFDGVPDVFATRKWAGGYLYDLIGGSSGGDASASGSGVSVSDGSDLKDVSVYNGDEDYLPSLTMTGSVLANSVTNWSVVGPKFTADLEIRGVNGLSPTTVGRDYSIELSGLNLRGASRDKSYYTIGEWISVPHYSEAESNAFMKAWNAKHVDDALSLPVEDEEAAVKWASAIRESDWSPENRTDPTLADTDGDLGPDGYEYYFWYLAHVGWMQDGEHRQLTGRRFSLKDIAVGEVITSEEIESLFNPTVKSGLDFSLRDSDNDGLTDAEELALGTNPVDWDTDGDGLSDFWEVMYGMNPLKTRDGEGADANADGDFMAKHVTDSTYLVLKFAAGVEIALPNYGAGVVVAAEDGGYKFISSVTNGISCIPVYRYGAADSEVVPTSREKPLEAKAFDPMGFIKAFGKDNGLFTVEVDMEASTLDNPVLKVTLSEDAFEGSTNSLMLVHDQVYSQFGFDPRTAWYKNVKGFVADRWEEPATVNKGPEAMAALFVGEAGVAQNTEKYTARDEYLLLKYRYMTGLRGMGEDIAKWGSENERASVFESGTTNPNVPFSAPEYVPAGLKEYASTIHGADTDGDGVPDGWELYVGYDPNTVGEGDVGDADNDGLGLVQEYAGTDSCKAYVGVDTIITNHPGHLRGWYNKFFPTDPSNPDTDGDGISDGDEGEMKSEFWRRSLVYGAAAHGEHLYTFIYGSNDGKPELDADVVEGKGLVCVRGGGLNPCSVDTDGDLLPDPWELEFAGIVFNAGGTPDDAEGLSEDVVKLIRRGDALTGSAKGYYISAGMDATYANDSYTKPDGEDSVGAYDERTGTYRDYDFDHDGLQNFQEYLVQSLRHLRYDDASTPLMGTWMPSGKPDSRRFVKFLPMNVMDGETFYADARAAGFNATGAWNFDKLGYFAKPPHAWDKAALNTASVGEYDEVGYRVMLRPQLYFNGEWIPASGYASTDPRVQDSDQDGMDDYYEVFHGLNPLLGSVTEGRKDTDVIAGDVIARAFGGVCSWYCNAWTGWSSKPPAEVEFDAVKYPWMNGVPEADPDGDGLRNADEALLVNMTSAAPTHTDPTPLWFTDSTALNNSSYVAQYYRLPSDLLRYPWGWSVGADQTLDGSSSDWMFAFEENEGYDTDHDGIPDGEEQKVTSTGVSDALDFSDPDRRQALWFPGDKSAAVTRWSSLTRPNMLEYDLFRQFTAEAWICPEDVSRDQVILERVCHYGADSISNSVSRLRANFRIGIMADGRVYGQFDTGAAVETGSGDGSVFVLGRALTAGRWTHVAISYDGKTLSLYVDGKFVGGTTTSQIPANGIYVLNQEVRPGSASSLVLGHGYKTVPSALVLGARAMAFSGVELSADSTFDDSYGFFYAGYLDEVRVWDGVRSASEIAEACKTRLSAADVKSMRDSVYAAWAAGATRNDNDGLDALPAELVLHYNFQTLPSGVTPEYGDVAYEPFGFTKNVRDAVRADGTLFPGDIYCGWWYETPVHSTVYENYRWVPWIPNTVGHLPMMDGSTVDSHYMGEYLGGVCLASEAGTTSFTFPNTMTPYPYYSFLSDLTWRLQKLQNLNETVGGSVATELYSRYRFQLRSGFVGSSDLVPLGGAFARRTKEMWDGNGPSDAWLATGDDLDANGIPDWWQDFAMAEYDASEGFNWDSLVNYGGVSITAREAYLRDLAKGMLPDGTIDSDYASRADVDNDGLLDWWENLYGYADADAYADSDGDGLSNYAEYLIGEGFSQYGFPSVKPDLPMTFHQDGQRVPDYFLTFGSLYLGEMFSDHDFMEDEWEDRYGLSRALYNPWNDDDDDGWSNFAECRALTDPSRELSLAIEENVMPEYPVPLISLTAVRANGRPMSGSLVVRAYSEKFGVTGVPDATWKVAGAGGDATSCSKFIGVNPGKPLSVNLGPASVVPGTVKVAFKDTYPLSQASGKRVWNADGTDWVKLIHTYVSPHGDNGDYLALINNFVGEVDYKANSVRIDFGSLPQYVYSNEETFGTVADTNDWTRLDLAQCFVKVEWSSKAATDGATVKCQLSSAEPMSSATGGHVREGRNTFVVFMDENGDGEWTPGEPYGVASDVDVGWNHADVKVELTDTSAQTVRIALADALGATDFATANALTDRGVKGSYYENFASAFVGTQSVASARTRVRIVRSSINEVRRADYNRVVYDETLDLTANSAFTEANLREAGLLDLDWGRLTSDFQGTASYITNATYRIVLGDGPVDYGVTNNNFAVLFGNVFERSYTKTAPDAGLAQIVYSGSPTFRWKHEPLDAVGNRIKDYPAFKVQIYSADQKTVVYESDAMPAPVRDSNGYYSWTAPVYAGMVTPKGYVFETTNNYYWAVSMLDAKFTSFNSGETKMPFRLNTTGNANDGARCGSIKVAVKYFGPLAGSLSTSPAQLKNLVHVQAFTTPDFSGQPVGEAYVTNVTTVAEADTIDVNAVICGLPESDSGLYYVRAYVDTNGDFKKDAWESWGYGCNVGNVSETSDGVRWLYTPRGYKVGPGLEVPTAEIYIEDADTDNDGFPDAWEMDGNGNLDATEPASGNTFFVKVNPNLSETIAAYTKLSADGAFAALASYPMGSLLANGSPATLALLAPSASASSVKDVTTLKIDDFSVEGGITLSVSSEATVGGLTLLAIDDVQLVTVWLVASETPDFANAVTTKVKTIEIRANDETIEKVSSDEVKAAMDAANVSSSAFLKVKLTK